MKRLSRGYNMTITAGRPLRRFLSIDSSEVTDLVHGEDIFALKRRCQDLRKSCMASNHRDICFPFTIKIVSFVLVETTVSSCEASDRIQFINVDVHIPYVPT